MRRFGLITLSVLGSLAWAEEAPVERSSHPRGFASEGMKPPMSVPTAQKAAAGAGVGTAQDASATTAKSGHISNQTTASGGVSVTGNTRLDARAQSGISSAVGEQNTAGNRVGSIGGK